MASFKEIVTKTIIGKGKKHFKNKYSIDLETKPSTVLGCWVINHTFKGYKNGDAINVTGSFDVNIWYSYDNDSKTLVANKKIEYNDIMNVKVKNDSEINNDTEIIVRSLTQPICSNVLIDGDKINFDIEKEIGVELVGDSKIKIATEDDEDPWDILEDEIDDEKLKEINNSIDENYIN